MMTTTIVFKIFEDYLKADTALEVVQTRHGYAVMLWGAAAQNWSDVVCPTPESLFKKLIESAAAWNRVSHHEKTFRSPGCGKEKKRLRYIRQHYLKLKEVMGWKILLKIVVAPLVVLLTLAIWICVGLVYVSGLVLGAGQYGDCFSGGLRYLLHTHCKTALFCWWSRSSHKPIWFPLAAIWLLEKVQDLKFAIQDLVYG